MAGAPIQFELFHIFPSSILRAKGAVELIQLAEASELCCDGKFQNLMIFKGSTAISFKQRAWPKFSARECSREINAADRFLPCDFAALQFPKGQRSRTNDCCTFR